MQQSWRLSTVLLASALVAGRSSSLPAAEEIYAAPNKDDVRGKVLVWAAEQTGVDAGKQAALQQLWSADDTERELLDLVIDSFAVCHDGAAKLVQESRAPSASSATLHADWINDAPSPFFQANVRLFLARALVERRLFDEAHEVLTAVEPREVVDPPLLFFARAVAAQELLEVSAALSALDTLLARTEDVPVRYSTTATLMQAELQSLREKSLGEIARMMSDSERRLDLGRAGEKVQDVQDRIITNLDDFIKKMEAQSAAAAGGGGGPNPSNESSAPADDSRVKGATAPGETDPKKFSKDTKWGDLPPAKQAEAKNLINRNFPSHYRQAIETYFKKLATRPAGGK